MFMKQVKLSRDEIALIADATHAKWLSLGRAHAEQSAASGAAPSVETALASEMCRAQYGLVMEVLERLERLDDLPPAERPERATVTLVAVNSLCALLAEHVRDDQDPATHRLYRKLYRTLDDLR